MRHNLILAATFVAFGLSTSAGAAPLDGATLDLTQADGFVITTSPFVVGSGIETTSLPSSLEDIEFLFDFTATGLLTIAFSSSAITSGFSPPFAPFVFSDVLGTLPDFTGFTLLSSNYAEITQADLGFTADTLSFDFVATYSDGEILTAQITLAEEMPPIPLPASLPLLAGGALALAALAHRRRV